MEKKQSFKEKFLYMDSFTAALIFSGFFAIIMLIVKYFVI